MHDGEVPGDRDRVNIPVEDLTLLVFRAMGVSPGDKDSARPVAKTSAMRKALETGALKAVLRKPNAAGKKSKSRTGSKA